MSEKIVIECNGYEDGINDMLDVVSMWHNLETEDFYRDSNNKAWVSLLSLASLGDELLS